MSENFHDRPLKEAPMNLDEPTHAGHDHDDHDHHHDDDHGHEKSPAKIRDTRYWQSLEEWSKNPEFQKLAEQEFQSSPLKESDDGDGVARRDFLKLMGASLALATASCVRRPVQKIVPYSKQPEEVTLGVPNYYTSSWFDGSEGFGLIVKTREGRPIKVEGNPAHPSNQGGLNARAQGHILNLYDPDRLQKPMKLLQNKQRTNFDAVAVKWDDADKEIAAQLAKGDVVFLSGHVASPTFSQLLQDFSQAFKARHVVWEPLGHEDVRAGQRASYGDDVVPRYRFDHSKMTVSIDADFLGTWIAPTAFARDFSKTRKPGADMSRLVVFESHFSLTGANADTRVRIKPSQQIWVAMGLLHELVVKKGLTRYSGDEKVKSILGAFANAAQNLGIEPALLTEMAQDLWAARGQSLVVAGGLAAQTQSAVALQVAVNLLNSALENDGKTVDAAGAAGFYKSSSSQMSELIKDMSAKKVKTLIIHRSNPVYALPATSGFKEALKNVGMVIYTGDRQDETGRFADYILPDNHSMEAWGDGEFVKGVYSIQQPTIRPLFDTRSVQFNMMNWAFTAKVGPERMTKPESYYEYLRNYWKEQVFPKSGKGKDFEEFWFECLQTGVCSTRAESSASARSFKTEAVSLIKAPAAASGYELVLYPSVQIGDGSLSNVSWLQELPEPVTKITWGNYLSVSIATAEKEGLKQGSNVDVTVGDQKLNVPVHIQPGLHDEVLTLAVGYGRTAVGGVGNHVGVNAFTLATLQNEGLVFSGQKAGLTKTGGMTPLAQTQTHHSMEGRQIVAETTLASYLKNNGAGIHRHKIWTIFPGHRYDGHKWGMTVDLNSCTGCSACMVACHSENNIPVVGKKYVIQNREMHWIRLDRYYIGDPANPETVFQPMMCQHCDNAPCESVCPVLATTHSDEGLNDMVYNRCVGTRYCSNNCPYKVRRFNWFSYTHDTPKPLHMAFNPEVTVRSRGVMEKCTFCVQRIKDRKQVAKLEKRGLKDGDVKTACEQSCPTQALTFGDMNDPTSRVSQLYKQERAYAVLEEFNAQPSIRYLTKIRNTKESAAEKGEHS